MDTNDVRILRELARQVRDCAYSPRMEALRKKWTAHNDMRTDEPVVIIEINELKDAFVDGMLCCRSEDARSVERELRLRLFQDRNVGDDTVVDAIWRVKWKLTSTGWRQRLRERRAADSLGRTVGHVPIPILEEPWDTAQLCPTRWTADRAGTLEELSRMQALFGDLLDVRLDGNFWWTMGTTGTFLQLTGMDAFLTMPYDDPEAFLGIMDFLEREQLALLDFLRSERLLTLNNANDYVGSGTHGYTTLLPGPDFDGTVRPQDLWVLLESQESSTMSPKMFGEMIFPHQKRMAERFGLCYYGCCEPIDDRFSWIRTIRNLHSVSISPWCDPYSAAEQMEGRYVFCRKPNPAWISTGVFEEDALRRDTRITLEASRGTPVELVMKDVHTVNNDASRPGRWTQLVREEIARAGG